MINNQITAFLKQAKFTASASNKTAETVTVTATFITPIGQYVSLGVDSLTEFADYAAGRSEYIKLNARLQPGVFFNQILPYRDDLTVQVIFSSETDRVLREFVGIPLIDKDLRAESNSTIENKLEALNETNLVSYPFQLMEMGFAKLRNVEVSDIHQIANVRDSLIAIMEGSTQAIGLTGREKYKGMEMFLPVDNVNNYRQILFPSGTRLIDVPSYLQDHNEYGVYSKGLGCFYKQNHWWIYPLFNTDRVDTHPRPIDLIRVPENKIPDLDATFYRSDVALTIISTGKSVHKDDSDIRKQNQGVGHREIMGDAIAGDTGFHYNNGRGISTREDSMQEYKLSTRRNGNDWVPLNPEPTGNMMKGLSINARNEGEIIELEWRNGDTGYLEPGHPVRFQYLYDDDSVMVRKAILLGYRTDYIAITSGIRPMLKRTTILTLFVKSQEKYKTA